MFVNLPRVKSRVWLLTVTYRGMRAFLRWMSPQKRLALFLDLEWIFARLSHEESFRHYGNLNHPLLEGSVRYLSSKMKGRERVLDLGCGHGDISYLLAQAGHEVVGIDHASEHIASAVKNYQHEGLSFECRDAAEYLRANKIKFDALVLSHVLEHLDDPIGFIRTFSGFFRHIFIEVPDFDCSYLNGYRLNAGAKLVFSDSDHVIEFDRDELLRTVKEAGLVVEDQEFRYGVLRVWCRAGG